MKLKSLIICTALLFTAACASKDKSVEVASPTMTVPPTLTGSVKTFLSNPHGDVDGLILQDGTQINFAPRPAAAIREVISANDRVEVQAVAESTSENNKFFRADKITNLTNSKTIDAMTPPMAPPRPVMPETKKERTQAGLKPFSVKGTVNSQIYNPEGEVRGVVLQDNTVVLFSPNVMDHKPANINVGDNFRASGYGTQNAYGKSIEASEVHTR